MTAASRTHLIEAAIGLVVVVAAIVMVVLFLDRTGGGGGDDPTEITALFPNASGVEIGTDVRVAGLSVGRVVGVALDPQGYQAEVRLAIDPAANLPNDSSAAITSEGLLGGSYIAMLPGGSDTPFKTDDVVLDTQGAVDMVGLVGSMLNGSGGSEGGDASDGGDDGFDTMSEDFDTMAEPSP